MSLFLHSSGSFVEVIAVIVDACMSVPAKSLALSPVIVAPVKLPELLSEMSQRRNPNLCYQFSVEYLVS